MEKTVLKFGRVSIIYFWTTVLTLECDAWYTVYQLSRAFTSYYMYNASKQTTIVIILKFLFCPFVKLCSCLLISNLVSKSRSIPSVTAVLSTRKFPISSGAPLLWRLHRKFIPWSTGSCNNFPFRRMKKMDHMTKDSKLTFIKSDPGWVAKEHK